MLSTFVRENFNQLKPKNDVRTIPWRRGIVDDHPNPRISRPTIGRIQSTPMGRKPRHYCALYRVVEYLCRTLQRLYSSTISRRHLANTPLRRVQIDPHRNHIWYLDLRDLSHYQDYPLASDVVEIVLYMNTVWWEEVDRWMRFGRSFVGL